MQTSKLSLKEHFLNCNDITVRSLEYGIETNHPAEKLTRNQPKPMPAVSPANRLYCILLGGSLPCRGIQVKGQERLVQALHAEFERW